MTSKTKVQESEVIRRARTELRIAAEELQHVRRRVAATIGRLMAAVPTAEVLGTNPYTGETLTAERWSAGVLSDILKQVKAVAAEVQGEAECDWQGEVEEEVAEMTAAKAAGKP